MDDLSVDLMLCKSGCLVGDVIVNHLMYADDLVLISPSGSGLDMLLEVCEQYGCSHDIKYNGAKSAVMIYKNSFLKNVDDPKFTIGSDIITNVPNVKYLGHILSADRKDDLDIMRQSRALYCQGNILVRKFHMCTNEVKKILFSTFFSSLYTCQLWYIYTKGALQKLIVAYNNVFRHLMHLPRFCSASEMFAMNRVRNVQCIIRNSIFRFNARLTKSENTLITAIMHCDMFWISSLRRHWLHLLSIPRH
jgi:hypothetical protein